MSARVFVVQDQQRMNRDTGRLEPKFDLTAAERFGKLVYLLSPTARPFNPQPIVRDLRDRLRDFCYTDFLLLLGNPALIGMAVHIAAEIHGGVVTMLQWNGERREYVAVRVDFRG